MNDWRWIFVGGALVAGCGPASETTETEAGSSGSGETSGTSGGPEPTTGEDPFKSWVRLSDNRAVDILFVVDNSGSTAPVQAALAAAAPALVEVLDAAEVAAEWRLGVTTTDSGNPRCPAAVSTPENGSLVLSSCLDRVAQDEFTFNGEDFSWACSDLCAKSTADLPVTPTATQYDEAMVPRAWLERGPGGALNVDGATAAEALQCYLPQGVSGCGFESHLESMYRALAQSVTPESKDNYGFLREAAVLQVVIVSDETDCSYSPDHKGIFIDNKVFWNSPDDPAPTSAVCWRAGVMCEGSSPYEVCHSENWDEQGAPSASDADAVLHPLSKYVEFVQAIEDNKKMFDQSNEVGVALIAGVPVGYEDFDSELVYEDSPDADLQSSFGIGPGCLSTGSGSPRPAVPPVREREFAEAFQTGDQREVYSVCEEDLGQTMARIGQGIADRLYPTCFPNCAADVDPDSPGLDVDCEVVEEVLATDSTTPVPACEVVDGAWAPPAGSTVCYGLRLDPGGQTPGALDDMSTACVEEGFNLEFKIVRTAPPPAGATISAACDLSANKKVDCPNL
jgi:hypothetical protein